MPSPAVLLAAILLFLPYLWAAFAAERWRVLPSTMSRPLRLLLPASLCIPYALVALCLGSFSWAWLVLYAVLPVLVAVLLWHAAVTDTRQHGTWLDYTVLLLLGLAVDLRWFERAWPAGHSALGKVLLLDAGLYGFLFVRQLSGVGLDLRLRWRDFGIGLREFLFYAPMAIATGLYLGFLHFHAHWPRPAQAALAAGFTFFLIALPEEIFFRGWLQNLLQRRMRRVPALLLTSVVFGLAHWNKRALHFNWRYVILATAAGIFYGRAWRQDRRVGAAVITHTCVDTVWSLWLR